MNKNTRQLFGVLGALTLSALLSTAHGTGFNATGSLHRGRADFQSTLLDDGKVLVTSGWYTPGGYGCPGRGSPDATAELYDPAIGTFSLTGGLMRSPRWEHAAVKLNDGRVLIMGGATNCVTNMTASAEIYDPVSSIFSPTGSMTIPRKDFPVAKLDDGSVLAFGGTKEGGTASATDRVDRFNPATGTFATVGYLAVGRGSHGVCRLPDGKFLLMGGSNYYNDTSPARNRSAEVYDPVTNVSRLLPAQMSFSRTGRTRAIPLANGKCLIGSYVDGGIGIEVFDPVTETFSTVPPIPGYAGVGTFSTSLNLLPDGRVLISPYPAMIYSPVSNTLSEVPRISGMPVASSQATTLPTGKVLISSGQLIGVDNPTTNAFLYDSALAPNPATVSLSPLTIEFGSTNYGQCGLNREVTISNSGGSNLAIAGIDVAAGDDGDFVVIGGTEACAGVAVPPGGTCSFGVTFCPTQLGPRSGSIKVASNAPGSPHVVAVQGKGVPVLLISPAQVNFGSVLMGSSYDLAVSVQNRSNGNVTLECASLQPFSLPSGCGLSVPAFSAANVILRFTPAATGLASGSLWVGAAGATSAAALTGEGLGLSPATSIDSLRPSSGVSGTVLTIRGGKFGPKQPLGANVRFGPATATVLSWSDKEVKVVAPAPLVETAPVLIDFAGTRTNSVPFTYAVFDWPVDIPIAIAQDFAEYGDVSAIKYHTGLDISAPADTPVYATAAGEVVMIQGLDSRDDHGFGNTVIVKHWLEGDDNYFFSQYSHLASVDAALESSLIELCGKESKKTTSITCGKDKAGIAITAETLLGLSGKSGFGQQEYAQYGWHLHFEMKKQKDPALAVKSHSTGDSCKESFGYTCEPPAALGYIDPTDRIFPVNIIGPIARSLTLGDSRNARFVPIVSGRALTTLEAGTSYLLLREINPKAGDGCATRWVKLARTDSPRCDLDRDGVNGLCFADTFDPDKATKVFLGQVPDAWVCVP